MEPIDAMDAALEAWAEQLAAQAATREDGRMTEPMANATWAAGRAARERGAEGWLARAYARGATNAPIVAGAISEADILAFANAAATSAAHAPRRLEELLVAFGRACRGVGPALGDCRDDVAGGRSRSSQGEGGGWRVRLRSA